jgi:two-component system response regulator FlrC
MSQNKVLVVEDDAGLREALIDTVLLAGYQCIEADSGESALLLLRDHQVDLIVSDVQMGGMSGLSLLSSVKNQQPNLPMLLMTAYGTIDDAVKAMKEGACNYITKPFAPEVLVNMINQYIPLKTHEKFEPIAQDSRSKALLVLAKKVATTDASVMILGPSGSGKEVLAQYVHHYSARSTKPFVAINCAAIPENMLEATLFGYEKGAFTGAVQACPGKFEQAQGGTILLDEITEMDLGLQAKILRVLQEREVERLGGRKTVQLDVRVIATSNRDLKEAVRSGVFREDLYYRLNVFPLTWLPLADRRDDIMPLTQHLIERICQKNGEHIPDISGAARSKLAAYHWPGNVRELDNVVQRALILHSNNIIEATDLLIENFEPPSVDDCASTLECSAEGTSDDKLGNELKIQEHQIILDTLHACHGSRKAVAERLGISPRTLRYKIARMRDSGIQIPA